MAPRVNIVINGRNLASKAIKDVTKDLSSASTASQRLSSAMGAIVKVGLGSAIAAAGVALTGILAAARRSSEWERFSLGFATMAGDAAEARQALSDLRSLAGTSLTDQSVIEGATQLLAYGTAASDTADELHMLGSLALGDSEKLLSLVEIYGQLRAKGKVSVEDLNRLTKAGVPIVDALATRLGMTVDQVSRLAASGKVGFSEVGAALEDLTTGSGRFAGALERQAETVSGKWSILTNTLDMALVRIGDALRPLTASALDTMIGKLNGFLKSDSFENLIATTVRWAAWAMDALPKVGAVLSFIGEAITITARHAAKALDGLKDIVVESPAVEFIVRLGGEAYEAIRHGFSTGDWAPALGVGADVFRAGVVVSAGLMLASRAVSTLWTSILMAVKGSEFLTDITGLGTAGLIGGASIAVALIEARGTGNWGDFKNSISAAIISGLAAGWLTRSAKAGVWVGTIALNLDVSGLLEKLPKPQDAAAWVKEAVSDAWEMTGIGAWWEEKGSEAGRAFIGSLWRVISLFDIVGAFVDLWNLVSSQVSAWWEERGRELGKAFLQSLWRVISLFDIVGAFVDLWNNHGVKVVDTVKGWFGLVDTRAEGRSMGSRAGEGFIEGLGSAGVEKKSMTFWEGVQKGWNMVWGIHSPSKVTEEMGSLAMEGFLNGVSDATWRTEILDAWHRLMEALRSDSTIDVGAKVAEITGSTGSAVVPAGPGILSGAWDKLKGGYQESGLATLVSGFTGAVGSFMTSLAGAVLGLDSVKAVLDPLATVLGGMMQVLSPLLDRILAPLIGPLVIIGRTIGQVLAPLLEALAQVTGILGEGFAWLYNNVILHVGNGIMTVFNLVYNAIAGFVNGIGYLVNWLLPKDKQLRMDYRDLTAGYLQRIDFADLTSAASSYIGGGSGSGVSGSSTSVQSYTIEVRQVVQGNVIGEGGMAELGRFFTEAVEAYMGSGGRVSFAQG